MKEEIRKSIENWDQAEERETWSVTIKPSDRADFTTYETLYEKKDEEFSKKLELYKLVWKNWTEVIGLSNGDVEAGETLYEKKGETMPYVPHECPFCFGIGIEVKHRDDAGYLKVMDVLRHSEILRLVTQERKRQESKWGEQNHEASMWTMIFQEEFGEAIQAYLQGRIPDYRKELIECAAVLFAWIESEMRRYDEKPATSER